MRYKAHYDCYGLPIPTKEYVLAQLAGFFGVEYEPPGSTDESREWRNIRKDWGAKIGDRPNPSRRVILYALRIAQRDLSVLAQEREEQLIQLCRKFSTRQPTYWERFLRERYQYAKTRDFFAIDYNDITWEYYAFDDECDALGADPEATGRVFDAKPKWAELMKTLEPLIQKK